MLTLALSNGELACTRALAGRRRHCCTLGVFSPPVIVVIKRCIPHAHARARAARAMLTRTCASAARARECTRLCAPSPQTLLCTERHARGPEHSGTHTSHIIHAHTHAHIRHTRVYTTTRPHTHTHTNARARSRASVAPPSCASTREHILMRARARARVRACVYTCPSCGVAVAGGRLRVRLQRWELSSSRRPCPPCRRPGAARSSTRTCRRRRRWPSGSRRGR